MRRVKRLGLRHSHERHVVNQAAATGEILKRNLMRRYSFRVSDAVPFPWE